MIFTGWNCLIESLVYLSPSSVMSIWTSKHWLFKYALTVRHYFLCSKINLFRASVSIFCSLLGIIEINRNTGTKWVHIAADNYVSKVNNKNFRTKYEICSKLTIKTQRRQMRRSIVLIVNFEHITHLVLKFLLLTLSR